MSAGWAGRAFGAGDAGGSGRTHCAIVARNTLSPGGAGRTCDTSRSGCPGNTCDTLDTLHACRTLRTGRPRDAGSAGNTRSALRAGWARSSSRSGRTSRAGSSRETSGASSTGGALRAAYTNGAGRTGCAGRSGRTRGASCAGRAGGTGRPLRTRGPGTSGGKKHPVRIDIRSAATDQRRLRKVNVGGLIVIDDVPQIIGGIGIKRPRRIEALGQQFPVAPFTIKEILIGRVGRAGIDIPGDGVQGVVERPIVEDDIVVMVSIFRRPSRLIAEARGEQLPVAPFAVEDILVRRDGIAVILNTVHRIQSHIFGAVVIDHVVEVVGIVWIPLAVISVPGGEQRPILGILLRSDSGVIRIAQHNPD